MKKNIKQHIVPQSYLKRFSKQGEGQRSSHYLNVRLKLGQQTFQQSISEVAFVKNYYDVTSREDIKYWEKYFASNIEKYMVKN